MPKQSFENIDEPFSQLDETKQTKDARIKKSLPDFDLDEPFVEDLPESIRRSEEERMEVLRQQSTRMLQTEEQQVAAAKQEEIRRRIALEADLMESERQRGVASVSRLETPEEVEVARKAALVDMINAELTGDLDAIANFFNIYISNLPDNMNIMAAMQKKVVEDRLRELSEPLLVELMENEKMATVEDITKIESQIFSYLKEEIDKRKIKPAQKSRAA